MNKGDSGHNKLLHMIVSVYLCCFNYYACQLYRALYILVTGEANFSMERTSLVVGGFTQPMVARSMIEQPGSTEKGLAQRFLWLFPQPVFEEFSKLEPISETFTEKMGR